MTDGGYIGNTLFMMVADGIVNVDILGNITRENGSSINNFNGLWGF
jgi:hypothetical protein